MAVGTEPELDALPPIGARGADLTKRQKAAIVVRLLLAEGTNISLTDLPEELQAELTRQMTEMRFVDRATLSAVVEEFLSEIDRVGLSFPDGLEAALRMLDGAISADTASRLRQQAGLVALSDPWELISNVPADRLVPILERESVELAAIMLSKLKVSKAAEVLNLLPGERARHITYAISQTDETRAETVRKIGLSLVSELNAERNSAFKDGPVQRLGAILNFSRSNTREDVLLGLDEEDADFAAEVRKAIFTFAVIPSRIYPNDIPKITREVDTVTLATAVAGATGKDAKAAEFILENMSKRLAESVREEAEAMGRVKKKDTEDALSAIVAAIGKMESEGRISQIVEEEEADD